LKTSRGGRLRPEKQLTSKQALQAAHSWQRHALAQHYTARLRETDVTEMFIQMRDHP
jgi:hypothetical protein